MDIEKLEALSCLKIEPSEKDKLAKSLHGIVDMLHSIDSVNLSNEIKRVEEKAKFDKDEIDDEFLVNKDNEKYHTVEGLFLAPKVIHKD